MRENAGLSAKAAAGSAHEGPVSGMSRRAWTIAALVILALAAFLRFYDLDLVPLHHDEGVNGNFLVKLVRNGAYKYDPENYHGPTLYYFAALFPRLLRLFFGVDAQNTYGLTTTAVRSVTSLLGLATVGLVFALRRQLGYAGTLGAAFLLAISPGAVYLSRYFIHESIFVFFTLAFVVALLKYYEHAQAGYLLAAAASLALLFATKETAIISLMVLLIAFGLTWVYWSIGPVPQKTAKQRQKARAGFVERMGGPLKLSLWILAAVALFVAINVVFYSSFFSNSKGIGDAIRTFEYWKKTGEKAHVHPLITYFWWLLLQESPLLILAGFGSLIAVFRPSKPFVLFCAMWAFGLTSAYSLISYKTPWLALNFIVPLALTSGVAIEWLNQELEHWRISNSRRVLAVVVLVVIVTGFLPGTVRAVTQQKVHWKTFIPGYQTIDLNFNNYDNDDRYYVYVYAHTRRETQKLINEIDRIARRTHQGGETGITIVAPEYWPLPWYLRDYGRVGYFGRMAVSNEPIVVASQSQFEEVQRTFGDRYQQVHSGFNTAGSFPLRPGVDLLLFTRRELVR